MNSEELGKVEITDGLLKYRTGPKYNNAYFKSKSFKISIEDIKAIGIYYTMIVDDDANILVFVDNDNKKYFIPSNFDLEEDSFPKILDLFHLDEAIFSPSYDNYDKGNSCVLYPKNLKRKRLYRKKNLIESFLWGIFKLFQIKYIGDGLLTQEIKNFIK
jgi:hypothetical protein